MCLMCVSPAVFVFLCFGFESIGGGCFMSVCSLVLFVCEGELFSCVCVCVHVVVFGLLVSCVCECHWWLFHSGGSMCMLLVICQIQVIGLRIGLGNMFLTAF